jgi:hypothetical protein
MKPISDAESWIGISTEAKPTGVSAGSTVYEVDTKKSWIYDPDNINSVTSTHWWDI